MQIRNFRIPVTPKDHHFVCKQAPPQLRPSTSTSICMGTSLKQEPIDTICTRSSTAPRTSKPQLVNKRSSLQTPGATTTVAGRSRRKGGESAAPPPNLYQSADCVSRRAHLRSLIVDTCGGALPLLPSSARFSKCRPARFCKRRPAKFS
ncbi:hypothetical protein M758_5G187200 [Ceratodon purpureus]|nr:hypothetical protein M758_5G187200 [Ceratodon purpureus]